MIKRLYHEISIARKAASSHRADAECPTANPGDAHQSNTTAAEHERKVSDLDAMIRHRLAAITMIEGLIAELEATPHRRRQLALAITEMENASSRLRRELGDVPK